MAARQGESSAFKAAASNLSTTDGATAADVAATAEAVCYAAKDQPSQLFDPEHWSRHRLCHPTVAATATISETATIPTTAVSSTTTISAATTTVSTAGAVSNT